MLKKIKFLPALALLICAIIFSCSKQEMVNSKISNSEAAVTSASITVKAVGITPITLGYFPSWSDAWVSVPSAKNSKLAQIPSSTSHIFLAFAKPAMRYYKGSYDLSNTGIQCSYDGRALKAVLDILKKKGTKVLLSIGGETYWPGGIPAIIYYQEIADFVKDFGLAGVDWDFEPEGSFQTIGNATNVAGLINMITKTRQVLPKNEGYLIAVAPSGVGALGGLNNDDVASPFKYANRNSLTGNTDAFLNSPTDKTRSISLFGFAATGHMIPVFKSVGSQIDIVATQNYNVGGAPDRMLMYNSYAYYANQYGFKIAAGIHVPNEPWGPYYISNALTTANHAKEIFDGGSQGRAGKGDGVMTWELLLKSVYPGETNQTGTSYMNICRNVFNGQTPTTAVANAFTYPAPPPTYFVPVPTFNAATAFVGQNLTIGIKQNGRVVAYLDGVQTFRSSVLKAGFYNWKFTKAGQMEFILEDINGHLSDPLSMYVSQFNQCGINGWNADKVYNTPNQEVYHNKWIWKNQWWSQGNIPGNEGVPYPVWIKVKPCN